MTYHGTKRKVFISYYGADRTAVRNFIDEGSNVFIAKEIGVYDDEDFINSNNGDYVMSQVRDKYLGDSTVTIVLIGTCTHSRRYIDWEIKSSLRQGGYTPNGLLGIFLPGISILNAPSIPERLSKNLNNDECYARCYLSPSTEEDLGGWIEDAFDARTTRPRSIINTQAMWSHNKTCDHCGVNHGV